MPRTKLWKDVPGYEGLYRVSVWGEVKSLARLRRTKAGGLCPVREKLLTPTLADTGYLVVSLSRNGVRRQHTVHSLVLTAFMGPPPEGTEARHLNGCRQDNRLANLLWGTHQENEDDKKVHGTRPTAANGLHGKALLSQEQANRIRELYATGRYSQTALAEMFGVYQVTVSNIVLNKSYKR